MSVKQKRINNAWRVLVGDPVRPVPSGPWWHAFGRIREFPRTDGQAPDVAHQLTVISPSTVPPEQARELAAAAWGEYLTSWDHEPSNREKEMATPEEFRQSEEELALWDELDGATPDEDYGEDDDELVEDEEV